MSEHPDDFDYVAYRDGDYELRLKCGCTCWYCLCTLEGHCGGEKCGKTRNTKLEKK